MADIHFKETLDNLDKLQVILYRIGVTLVGLVLFLPLLSFYQLVPENWFMAGLAVSCSLLAASLHIYDKVIRFIIGHATWLALLVIIINQLFLSELMALMAIGLLFITLSGIAFKESFCFRVWGLKLVPVVLFLAVFCQWLHYSDAFAVLTGVVALLYTYLGVVKWRMPLHFDIGDKSKYQQ